MSQDQSVSLGLIVTELAINALKHEFPDAEQEECHIDVAFASSPAGWVLAVSDNGCGLPDNHADAKPGLVTGIVNELAGQLAATVAVIDNDPGTKVSVSHVAANAQDASTEVV